MGKRAGRRRAEEADHRHRRLLRARRERPRRRRAAKQGDELAAGSHSINSSARSKIASGIFSPIALAVVRLMTRSNLVGCSTGMSAGFAPRKILSTSQPSAGTGSGSSVHKTSDRPLRPNSRLAFIVGSVGRKREATDPNLVGSDERIANDYKGPPR